MPAASALMRCWDRRRSSRTTPTAISVDTAPSTSDATVTAIIHAIPSALLRREADLSKLELHGYFHNDVNRCALPSRRSKSPLPHRLHRTIVQPGRQTLQELDIPHRAVTPDDDLKDHVADEPHPPGFIGVI